MSLVLIQPPTSHCVTLDEARDHVRVDGKDSDTLLNALIVAAEQAAEGLMGRSLMLQKWVTTADHFPVGKSPYILLTRPPVVSIDSINYVDQTGATVTMLSEDYQDFLVSELPARVGPAYGKFWPAARIQPDSVQVTFTSGYADAASVPEAIKAWIKLRIGTLYANRESDVLERGSDAHMGFVDYMLDPYKVWTL